MTEQERGLLLTVARLLRAQISDRLADASGENRVITHKEIADDFWAINESLKPFDPSPAEPINQAARASQ